MLRSLKSGIVLTIALAVAPVGLSTYGLAVKNAAAVATYRPGAMKPGSTRAYTAGGEMRVCNDGPVTVRLYTTNSLGSPTDSLLEPGRCNQNWGHMMYVVTENGVPAGVWPMAVSAAARVGVRATSRSRDSRRPSNTSIESGRSATLDEVPASPALLLSPMPAAMVTTAAPVLTLHGS
jgi:hypothetical protein